MTPICPSATGDAQEAQIIGFIGTDGVVATISPPILLTEEIRDAAGPRPESKFRLSGHCVEAKCGNWQNQACALIDRMREQVDRLHPSLAAVDKLKPCAIRTACVWWKQTGPEACRVCPFVIYNPSE